MEGQLPEIRAASRGMTRSRARVTAVAKAIKL